MADPDYSAFLAPDPQLAAFWEEFQNKQINQDQYNKLTTKRTAEISAAAGGVSLGIGSGGYVTPNYAYSEESGPEYASLLAAQEKMRAALANKEQLVPSATPGVYQKQYFDSSGQLAGNDDPRWGKTADITAKGTSRYDPNATSTKTFYDASGKQLTAAQVANTDSGKGFAAAGWDIGFGPGMIAPGVKADTTERDARRAARESQVIQTSTSVQTQVEQPEVDPIPLTSSLLPVSSQPPPPPTKTAPIDTILFDDNSMSVEIMTDLIFEDIGGHELLSISRNDIINGQQVSYSPIKNLGLIQQKYNPNNILRLQSTSDTYFGNFTIKLEEKIPEEGNGPNGESVYIDSESGDLIIETINMNVDEQIEVQVSINGTIYEANFGETVS
jgi:hypothetical protein